MAGPRANDPVTAPLRWRRSGMRTATRRAISRPMRPRCQSRARPASLVVEVMGVLRRAQITPEDVPADLPPLAGARLLVKAEVDAAVNPGVIDVVGDLPPGGVAEDDARQTGI